MDITGRGDLLITSGSKGVERKQKQNLAGFVHFYELLL